MSVKEWEVNYLKLKQVLLFRIHNKYEFYLYGNRWCELQIQSVRHTELLTQKQRPLHSLHNSFLLLLLLLLLSPSLSFLLPPWLQKTAATIGTSIISWGDASPDCLSSSSSSSSSYSWCGQSSSPRTHASSSKTPPSTPSTSPPRISSPSTSKSPSPPATPTTRSASTMRNSTPTPPTAASRLPSRTSSPPPTRATRRSSPGHLFSPARPYPWLPTTPLHWIRTSRMAPSPWSSRLMDGWNGKLVPSHQAVIILTSSVWRLLLSVPGAAVLLSVTPLSTRWLPLAASAFELLHAVSIISLPLSSSFNSVSLPWVSSHTSFELYILLRIKAEKKWKAKLQCYENCITVLL